MESSSPGKGRVLLMEDEDIIRKTISRLLVKLGYEVESARNGEETLEIYKKALDTRNVFDVIIMDLTIKEGMGGIETIQKLLEMAPEVKVILSSGHFNDEIMVNYRQYGFYDVITKPYEIEDLCDVLDRAIHPGD